MAELDKNVTLRLSSEDLKRIKARAKKEHIPFSVYVRSIILNFLDKLKD